MTMISCENVSKFYGRKNALHNLNISIRENRITGLVGKNGAGKTTLLKLIAGHIYPSSGEVRVLNEDPFNNLFVSANTIFIKDSMEFTNGLNLMELLEMGERFYPNWDMEFAKSLFSYFQLDELSYYDELSKGMKSTFNTIVGLASRCPLTLFDEPTSGMDASVRKDFYRALLKDYLRHPRTFIISSHYLDEIEDLLEDLLLIDGGEKKLHKPIDEVKNYAVNIMGDSNLLENQIPAENILAKKRIDESSSSYIVINDERIASLKRSNFNVQPVSPKDVTIYLTDKKGDIDDVFQSSNTNGYR